MVCRLKLCGVYLNACFVYVKTERCVPQRVFCVPQNCVVSMSNFIVKDNLVFILQHVWCVCQLLCGVYVKIGYFQMITDIKIRLLHDPIT